MSKNQGLYQDAFIEGLRRGLMPVLQCWGLSADTELSLLCISENATFRADDPLRDDAVVIRVHRPGYHSRHEIESELCWIDALREAAIVSTPRPLAGNDGKMLVTFDDAGESRVAVAFDFMPGSAPDESADLEGWFRQLGGITARLHAHSRSWHPPPDFRRKRWNFETTLGQTAYWGDWRQALGLDSDGLRLLARCSEQLQWQLDQIGETEDCFGLIHADLRLANLLVDDSRLTVIDFDDCGLGWYLYDFAAAISFIETSPDIPRLQAAWVEGYRRVAPLSADEVGQLATFVMLRRVLLTAWLASHRETPTARELGADYTQGTLALAQTYLQRHV